MYVFSASRNVIFTKSTIQYETNPTVIKICINLQKYTFVFDVYTGEDST